MCCRVRRVASCVMARALCTAIRMLYVGKGGLWKRKQAWVLFPPRWMRESSWVSTSRAVCHSEIPLAIPAGGGSRRYWSRNSCGRGGGLVDGESHPPETAREESRVRRYHERVATLGKGNGVQGATRR